jgi:hypothetical protein
VRISGGLSVYGEQEERIEYIRYLLNRVLEEKSRMRCKGARISTGSAKKEWLSILRDRKSEFESMTRFAIIDSVPSKVD